jgi:hypothetical protein
MITATAIALCAIAAVCFCLAAIALKIIETQTLLPDSGKNNRLALGLIAAGAFQTYAATILWSLR